ncbi:hypothetical protein QBC38DRAFT_518100 [Podospora fimiseda]|uniref:Uncharacterized protein n=1 Tax=Podospora fimiseda TaxID=252190 RepID=A0AAN6YQT2_9PEZI|nr:hypothetical protein QBC38DRAFT_518100 [Podospora fimiseda]
MAAATPTPTFTRGQIVPLTTTFTPPSDCFNNFPIRNVGGSVFEANSVTLGTDASKCYPAGFKSVTFSPGLCPNGWTGYYAMLPGIASTESRSVCCPRGYTMDTYYRVYCSSTSASLNGIIMEYISTASKSTLITSGIFVSVKVWHEDLVVIWRDGDFATSTSSPDDGDTTRTDIPSIEKYF